MWWVAILLPTPREPECRNSHTAPFSSAVTSMKWLPEPSVPSCNAQLPAYRPGSKRAWSALAVSRSTRRAADSVSVVLYEPADNGTARSIAPRRSDSPGPSSSRCHWVRTAAMPQPMSTPTAAGMIARNVGMTEPTVAPLPRCASGIRAMCGKTNGSREAASA